MMHCAQGFGKALKFPYGLEDSKWQSNKTKWQNNHIFLLCSLKGDKHSFYLIQLDLLNATFNIKVKDITQTCKGKKNWMTELEKDLLFLKMTHYYILLFWLYLTLFYTYYREFSLWVCFTLGEKSKSTAPKAMLKFAIVVVLVTTSRWFSSSCLVLVSVQS